MLDNRQAACPTISVIIPTYRRRLEIARALDSLLAQRWRDFEVIVVDNDGDRAVRELVHRARAAAGITIEYVAEQRLGAQHARHAGVRAAGADLLAFADDDETFAADWLGASAAAFAARPDMVAAGGPIRLVWDKEPPVWLARLVDRT